MKNALSFICIASLFIWGNTLFAQVADAKKSNSKISPDLIAISEKQEQTRSDAPLVWSSKLIMQKGNLVRVEAIAKKDGRKLAEDLKALEATEIDIYKRTVNAWLPISSIERLEEIQSLQWIKPVYIPVNNIGSVDSQGDSAMVVGMTRNKYCIDGDGVKIGVLSDSYNFLGGAANGVASGDLPGIGNPNGFTSPVTVVNDYSPGSDEGRAMCEIVHDLAPGSELFYATAFGGQATFANNILSLANTHACDVIVDDVYYFEEPMYMDGIIAQACNTVVNGGVAYFSAIGNSAQSSYESAFNPSPGGQWHDFDPGPGVDTLQSITVNAGSNVYLTLQWDDPWGSLTPNSAQTDMDLYIIDNNGTSFLLSSVRNNINVTLNPTEFINGTATGTGTVTFNIGIKKYAGPAPTAMKWVMSAASGLVINEYGPTTVTARATSNGHANAEGTIAVGACAWYSSPAYNISPPTPEPFTSSGGVQIRYDLNGNSITPIIRNKPEITATDGVSNTFFGSGNYFFGTSAAAPHAAALAALMLQADDALSPLDIKTYLQNSAIDMSTSGFDYLTGAGLVQADSALKQVYNSACNVNSITASNPILSGNGSAYSIDIKVKYKGATCTDSLIINGEAFFVTDPDSMQVTLSGLPADGQPVDVTATLQHFGCSLTQNALYTAPILALDTLVITEIMYDLPGTGSDSLEFIEIYNPSFSAVDMTGFSLGGATYIFGNLILPTGGYVVVCEDSMALFNQFGANGFQWVTGSLNNGGEQIVLKDANGNTIDSVDYDDSSPWPTNAGGAGPSIVLCDPSSDNNVGSNWTASTSITGKIINGQALFGSPGSADQACSSCPSVDSTYATATVCDSSLAGSNSTIHTGSDGCDSVHTVSMIYTPADSTALASVSICSGDSILMFGEWQKVSGTYSDTLANISGCDSIITQQLVVNTVYNEVLAALSICAGDSALIFGNWEKTEGIYYSYHQSTNGCDSVVSQELMVDSIISTSSMEIICTGDSTMIFGQWQKLAGMYSDTSASQQGCDSIHTVTLTLLPVSSGNMSVEICEGDSIFIGGMYFYEPGNYTEILTGANGCDSIVDVLLAVNPLDTTYQSLTTNDPLMAGVFDTTYSNINGCDSTVYFTITYVAAQALDTLVVTEIMYNPPESGSDIHEFIEIHNPGTLAVNLLGYTLSDAADYTFGNTIIPAGGYVVVCRDSTALYTQYGASGYEWSGVLNNPGELILLKDAGGNTLDSVPYANSGNWPSGADGDGPSIVLCDWTMDNSIGTNWAESSSSTGNTVNGKILKGSPGAADAACGACPTADSTYIETVTCDSTQAGMVVVILTNQNGCDSIVTTNTVFDPGSITSLPGKMICSGDSVLIFNEYESMAGTYFDTLQNINGCDSILTCELILKPIYQDTVLVQICTGDSLLIDGTYQSVSGYYSESFTSIDGCDSILVTEVLVLPEIMTSSAQAICEGDSLMIFGNYETMAGIYSDTAQSTSGCDSIHSVSLTVNPVSFLALADSICPGEGLFVGGAFQTSAGVYYDTLSAFNGCDSILETTLTVRTDTGCGVPAMGDSITVATSITGWTKSTVTNLAEAGGYPWPGVSTLPTLSTFTLPAEIGQPKPWHSIDSVEGAKVFKSGNGVTFFRTTFDLTVDTGVSAQFRSYMDDGMEIYINGSMIAREDDREVSNASGLQHHLFINQGGEQDNGALGDQEFDVVNNFRMDSIVHVGTNELIIALRNAPSSSDKGGFSFRMDIKTGLPYMPVLVGYIVSDAEWQKSTVSTPGGSSWNWPGISSLPAENTYTEQVELGQPYSWYSTEEVEGSFAVKAGPDVTYYRRRFSLVDSADINVRIRSTFDENTMIFVNDSLIAGHFQHGLTNRALPAHDVFYPTGANAINGNAGGDWFMQIEDVDFNQILKKGDNYVVLALQNRGSDKGGFSFRMDMDKAGSPVIRKTSSDDENNRPKYLDAANLDFDIYPNPTSGMVYINLKERASDDNEIVVTDVNGKVIVRRSLINPETGNMDIDLSFLPKGMYMVRVRSGEVFKGKPLVRF